MCWQATEFLSKIDPKYEGLIDLLIQFIHISKDGNIRKKAAAILENLTENREQVIEALIKLIERTCYKDTQEQVIESLAKIGIGSKKLIIYLDHVIKTTSDEFLYYKLVSILGNICQDNIGHLEK